MSTIPVINQGIAVQQTKTAKKLEPQRQIDDTQYVPKQFKDVAVGMEQQFAEYMLEQMNKTAGEEALTDSPGMDYYKALQNTERAKMMAEQNQLGLQNMVLDQIYPKRLRNEMALKHYEAQANKIHHNLPSYTIEQKVDTIRMGKNDSAQLPSDNTIRQNSEGDKL